MIRFEHYQYNFHKNKIQSIYERSFPKSERFDFDILKKCDREFNVHLSCILQDDEPVAEYEYNTKNGKVALYDKPITVELSKIDSATEKELPGAVLTLYRMDNDGDTKIETWTSTSESHVIKYLTPGRYKLHELKTAGPQYVMDEDLHPFTLILANSKISTFNVNETLPIKNVLARGNIKVLKVNKDGRAPLAGAEFDVFNADGKIVDHLVTGTDGTAMTKVLPYGKYSLRETKAPTGFVLSKATFDTEIIANGDVPLLEITNSTITKLGSKGIFIVVGLAVIFAGLVTVICFKLRRK